MIKSMAIIVVACCLSFGVVANELTLTIAGERMGEQIPYYTVSVGGMQIATGGAEKAMASDPTVGHIFKLADKAPFTQIVTYQIPDGVLKSAAPVEVTLTNPAYDQATQKGTMLLLKSISVNGTAAQLDAASAADGSKTAFFPYGSSVVINGKGAVSFPAPAGGWPLVAATEPAKPAIAAAAATPKCDTKTTMDLVGFDNAADSLSAYTKTALNGLIGTLGGQVCTLSVVGYSSVVGSTPINQMLSAKRAKAVADYLETKGVDVSAATIKGAGETDQFGTLADNRRVVVTVSP